jgi:hypothetical protein
MEGEYLVPGGTCRYMSQGWHERLAKEGKEEQPGMVRKSSQGWQEQTEGASGHVLVNRFFE